MKISMKTLLITVVAALVISFVFVIWWYYLLGSGSYPVLSAVVLGISMASSPLVIVFYCVQ